jgi:hypothetical protein
VRGHGRKHGVAAISTRPLAQVELSTMRDTVHIGSRLYDTVLRSKWQSIVLRGAVATDAHFIWVR